MNLETLIELRGFVEENFDELAAYLAKGINAPTEQAAIFRASRIVEELGEAISFGYEPDDYLAEYE